MRFLHLTAFVNAFYPNFFTRLTTFIFFLSFALFILFVCLIVFTVHCIVGTYTESIDSLSSFESQYLFFNGFCFLHCWSKVTVPLALCHCSVTVLAAAAVALAPLSLFTTNFGSRTRLVYAVLNFLIFFMYYNLLYVLNLYVIYVL